MKILVYTDCHFSTYSSIIRNRGSRFSVRLENLIESISWAENLAYDSKCDAVVCLGDFFDTSILSAEECVALQYVEWTNLPHYFLVGNHEMSGIYSTAHILKLIDNAQIIDSNISKIVDDCEICFLPYQKSYDDLNNIFGNKKASKRLIFSHNDIAGANYGGFISVSGFEADNIKDNCDLMLNGHIHNCGYVNKCIYNVGNITGQNFSEDAFKYNHSVVIIDTDTLEFEIHGNPHAFNFYKIDHNIHGFDVYNNLINNAVVTIKCDDDNYEQIKKIVLENANIIAHRFIVEHKQREVVEEVKLNDVDHLQQFTKYVLENIGQTDDVVYELSKVCK